MSEQSGRGTGHGAAAVAGRSSGPQPLPLDDNLFDEDDALDYIIYEEECEQERRSGGGCLTSLLVLPAIAAGWAICGYL